MPISRSVPQSRCDICGSRRDRPSHDIILHAPPTASPLAATHARFSQPPHSHTAFVCLDPKYEPQNCARVLPSESFFFSTTYRRVLGIRLAHARSDVGCETGPLTRGQFTRSHRTRRRRRSKDCMRRRVNPRQQASVAPRGRRAHHAVMCCRSQLQAVAVFGIPAVSPQHDGYVAVPPCQWLSCCYGTSPVVAALDRRRHKYTQSDERV